MKKIIYEKSGSYVWYYILCVLSLGAVFFFRVIITHAIIWAARAMKEE